MTHKMSEQKGQLVTVYFITIVHTEHNISNQSSVEGQIYNYSTNKVCIYKKKLQGTQAIWFFRCLLLSLPHTDII